jgi:hypothetical protein
MTFPAKALLTSQESSGYPSFPPSPVSLLNILPERVKSLGFLFLASGASGD